MTKKFSRKFKPLSPFCNLTCEQKLRLASEGCMVAGGLSLLASVAIWMRGSGGEGKAGAERLGIFVGLWVPSLLLTASYLTRKADDEALGNSDFDEASYFEELM